MFNGNKALPRIAWLCLAFLATGAASASAQQTQVDRALTFFRQGGAYCFRVAPEGVAMAEEQEWTIMLLTSKSSRKDAFKIRQLDSGTSRLRGAALRSMGEAVTGVWRNDASREEFFARFGMGIEAGVLRARVVRIRPNNLAQLTSDRARAELYLQWSDRGSSVAFKGVPDLTAEEFAQYSSYFPD
jgi:hypothetical protein